MTGVRFGLQCIILLLLYQSSDATYKVLIERYPAGTPVDDQPDTFDYPLLTCLYLTCLAISNNSLPFAVKSYQWNTKECYTNGDVGYPRCFPHGKKTQSVVGHDLNAKDAGTITCTVTTINNAKYTSDPLTLRISGVTLVGGQESTGNDDVSFINIIRDYSFVTPKNRGILFRCVSGLGPTSNNNSELGELHFNSAMIHHGKCNGPIIQPRGATIDNYVGIINVFLCGNREFSYSDEGVYTCTMKNSNMDKESVRVGIYLDSRTPPVLTTQSNAIPGVFGEPLILTCTSKGSPPDTFIWMKDGKQIQNNISTNRISYTRTSAVFQTTYKISTFSSSDIGTYICIITNPIGSASTYISVFNPLFTVPFIFYPPENYTTIELRKVTLTCGATGKPSAKIQWIKAGKVLDNSSNNATKYIINNKVEGNCVITNHQSLCWSSSELSIINSEPSDSGEYICNATNKVGNSAKTATLIVKHAADKGNPVDAEEIIGIMVPAVIILCILVMLGYLYHKIKGNNDPDPDDSDHDFDHVSYRST